MDLSGLGSSLSSDPKTAIMTQIRQEAAVANARALVEVHRPHTRSLEVSYERSTDLEDTETQRALLRTLRAQAWYKSEQSGRGLFYSLHAEIYGQLEHGVETVCCEDSEGCGPGWGRVGRALSKVGKEKEKKNTGSWFLVSGQKR